MNHDPQVFQYAEVTLYTPSPTGTIVKWDTVLPGSTVRHSDGSFSFEYRCQNDHKIRRVTVYGTYYVKYPPDPADKR